MPNKARKNRAARYESSSVQMRQEMRAWQQVPNVIAHMFQNPYDIPIPAGTFPHKLPLDNVIPENIQATALVNANASESFEDIMEAEIEEIIVEDNTQSCSIDFNDENKQPRDDVELLTNGFNLKSEDLNTLQGTNWLNDEVINCYLNILAQRNENNAKLPKIYAFNTFFYPKLFQMGFGAVKRFTRKVDIFSYEMLLVPIHLGNHWCMAIVDFGERRIDYYDSLMSQNQECLQLLREYLKHEFFTKKLQSLDMDEWKFTSRNDIPVQKNSWDCGILLASLPNMQAGVQ